MEASDPRDQIIAELREQNALLRKRVAELEERLNKNSTNSSKPPSTDPPGTRRKGKETSGRKPGGQPGHKRNLRELVAVEKVDHLNILRPEICTHCREPLHGCDPQPLRHQVIEIPVVKPTVSEWQLHKLQCSQCGKQTRAQLPVGVANETFGPVLSSVVALCTVRFRQSKRLVQELLSTMLNVELSLGAICKIEQKMSQALAVPVQEACVYVQQQARANADETGWYEGKADGKKQRAWLWVVTTCLVTVFRVAKSRGEDIAKEMLGEGFAGILGSDRWSAYNFVVSCMRQLCWSHLIRDFQSFIDRVGKGAQIGEKLLEQVQVMFGWWHRVRDGTLQRRTFERRMQPVQRKILRLLRSAAQNAEPKTRGMAKAILKFKAALFTFVRVPNVEPTNNVSERQVRQGVILRKLSFGTESANGSRFVERMLTATTTLRQQERNVLDYLIAAHQARINHTPAPSLLPAA
jgi:transposase